MANKTKISWCDMTHNHWVGCQKVSPACDGCYAEHLMDTRFGRVECGAPGKGVGTRQRTSAGNWHQPVRWNAAAAKAGTRPFVFCASLADVFDNQVPTAWRRDLFDLIRATPHLVWLLLTKRPQLIVRLYNEAMLDPPDGGSGYSWPSNAAIGTTVEDQERADINVPALVDAKAALSPAFAFLSCEPLLGPIDLERIRRPNRAGWGAGTIDALRGWSRGAGHGYREFDAPAALDWVITGGETDQGDHKARPTHPGWLRSLRDQCAAAGVAYHHKQNGEWLAGHQYNDACREADQNAEQSRFPAMDWDGSRYVQSGGMWCDELDDHAVFRVGKHRSGRAIDGIEHDARPAVGAA